MYLIDTVYMLLASKVSLSSVENAGVFHLAKNVQHSILLDSGTLQIRGLGIHGLFIYMYTEYLRWQSLKKYSIRGRGNVGSLSPAVVYTCNFAKCARVKVTSLVQ